MLNDGVDFVPMKKWKNSLIQLLNIAGTGPILGPIQGILFGPIAFITIPIGCVIGGAFHDYMSGMISVRNDGKQMPSLIQQFLGKHIYVVYNIFVCLLMLLVGTAQKQDGQDAEKGHRYAQRRQRTPQPVKRVVKDQHRRDAKIRVVVPVVVGTVPCVRDTAGVSLAVVVDIVQLCQLRRSVQIQRHPAVPECVKGLHIGVISGSPVDQRIGDGGEIRTQEQQRRGSTDERHNQHRCPMAEFGAVIGNAVQRIDTNPLHQSQRCKQQQIPHSGKGIGHGAVQHHGFQRDAALELGELQLDLPQRPVRVNLEVAGAPLPRRIFFADDLKRLGEIVVLDGGLH